MLYPCRLEHRRRREGKGTRPVPVLFAHGDSVFNSLYSRPRLLGKTSAQGHHVAGGRLVERSKPVVTKPAQIYTKKARKSGMPYFSIAMRS